MGMGLEVVKLTVGVEVVTELVLEAVVEVIFIVDGGASGGDRGRDVRWWRKWWSWWWWSGGASGDDGGGSVGGGNVACGGDGGDGEDGGYGDEHGDFVTQRMGLATCTKWKHPKFSLYLVWGIAAPSVTAGNFLSIKILFFQLSFSLSTLSLAYSFLLWWNIFKNTVRKSDILISNWGSNKAYVFCLCFKQCSIILENVKKWKMLKMKINLKKLRTKYQR